MIQLFIREYHIYIVTAKMDMEKNQTVGKRARSGSCNSGTSLLALIKKYVGSIVRYQKKGGGLLYGACVQYKDSKCSATFGFLFQDHISAMLRDHHNLNRLDCWKANLSLVDKMTQFINWGLQVNNKTGIMGVTPTYLGKVRPGPVLQQGHR